MKSIRHKETLFYYDCPQVFVALDNIGGHYLCVLGGEDNTPDDELDEYLVIGIPPEELRKFKSGSSDLLALLLEFGGHEWFTIKTDGNLSQFLELKPMYGPIPESYLPEIGFELTSPPLGAEYVQMEAKARNNLVIEAWIDPPEAARESKIHALTLAAFLNHLQVLIKHSLAKARSKLSPDARKLIPSADAHIIDAFGFASGSFKVRFEAAVGSDLFGFVELQRAMEKLDEIADNCDSPPLALEVMKNNQGHIVSAYIRMLDFLIRTNSAFAYRWSPPSGAQSGGRSITTKQARPLYELLTQSSQLGIESAIIHGYLRKANSKNNTWTIESVEDAKEYSGECKNDVSVSHLTIDQLYLFNCEEVLEIQQSTGREISKLLLISSEEV